MKHTVKISLILICMFIVTQMIGLFVVNTYLPTQATILNETTGEYQQVTIQKQLPFNMTPPEIKPADAFSSIIFAFIFVIILLLILMKYKVKTILRVWFFVVVVIALGITLSSFFINSSLYTKIITLFSYPIMRISSLIVLLISLPFAYYKIYRQNILVHNITELLIYPGLATVFVFLFVQWDNLGVLLMILLLVLISIYDIWAVWKSKIMIKMAKFQINELKVFGGFFLPYANNKVKQKIEFLKQKYKNKKIPEKEIKKHKIRVNLAILGGGDVVFPIIAAGVILKTSGLIPALFVVLGATIALLLLFLYSEKGKSYPAMPFLTAGIIVGMLLGLLF